MKKYDWKNEYNPIRRTAKRLLSGEPLTDGRPLSDLIELDERKPDADTRQALKSEGFKWAPSQGAWQRQLNQNAIRAAARLDFLRPEDGKSPYQLQPFAKRVDKDVSR